MKCNRGNTGTRCDSVTELLLDSLVFMTSLNIGVIGETQPNSIYGYLFQVKLGLLLFHRTLSLSFRFLTNVNLTLNPYKESNGEVLVIRHLHCLINCLIKPIIFILASYQVRDVYEARQRFLM